MIDETGQGLLWNPSLSRSSGEGKNLGKNRPPPVSRQNSSTVLDLVVFEFLEKSFSNFAVLEDRNGPIRSKRSGTTARISCTFA